MLRSLKTWSAVALAAALALGRPVSAQRPGGTDPVRFNRDIRPILSDNCFQCHGADAKAREADLRLDTWEGMTALRGWKRPAVVPGNPDGSALIQRVRATESDRVMPPPETQKSLEPDEIALLERWIAEGAPFERHWAFVPPRREEVPEVESDEGWARTAVDRFVLARMREQGLEPNAEADRATLIRRATLDLTGLPPTPAEVDAFLADSRPDAYERLLDDLMQRPAHAERMAQLWLDAARYADTNGFHHDNVRTAWPYRDWVIRAFADNKPYDRFVVEQLAGDLLARERSDVLETDALDADEAESLRIATAFCRMHNINDEGGAIDAEYRVEAIADRIETVGTALMGMTFTCARCHDHKYDPISQEDYYSLYSIFGSVDERGVYSNNFEQARAYPARLEYRTPEQKRRIADLEAQLAAAVEELRAVEPEVEAEVAAWARSVRGRAGVRWARPASSGTVEASAGPSAGPLRAELLDVSSDVEGVRYERLEDGSVLERGPAPGQETVRYAVRIDGEASDRLRLIRYEALGHPSHPGGLPGRSSNGNVVVSSFSAEAVSVADPSRRMPVRFAHAWADVEQQNGEYEVLNAIREGRGQGWAFGSHERAGPRTAILVAEQPFGFEGGTRLEFRVDYRSVYDRHVAGRTRITVGAASEAVLEHMPLVASDWWMAGPYGEDQKSFDGLWEAVYPPVAERSIVPGRKLGARAWQHRADLREPQVVRLSGPQRTWYFAKEVRTPVARELPLSLGSDDSVRVYLDGEVVYENRAMRGVAPDQDRVVVDVPAGEHLLVVQVLNNGGPGGFYGRLDRDEETPEPLAPLALLPDDLRRDDQRDAMLRAFGRRSPTFARLDDRRTEAESALQEARGDAVPVLVMEELEEPMQYHVLTRGTYDAPDPERPVDRALPEFLAPGGAFPEGLTKDRLGFARWLTSPDHPLTARVHVNRLWMMLFGRGLVRSQENFGVQAEYPSHPQLLDWLARTFVEDGWDQRALLRRIMTSSVYRQSAAASPRAAAVDPDDKWLSHFPRMRLPGEFVRDLALSVSGLLVDRVGGPSVRPYQPAGLWREVSIGGSSNTQVFRRDEGEDLYRRSIYTFWKRTSPNPQMAIFDAPTREFCVVQRSVTNTPLQALVLWNDPQFVEASRRLAERVLASSEDDGERIRHLFRICTGRRPDAEDLRVLQGLLHDLSAGFGVPGSRGGRGSDSESSDSESGDSQASGGHGLARARKLLAVGETTASDAFDPRLLAAWTLFANTVLQLDETIVRD